MTDVSNFPVPDPGPRSSVVLGIWVVLLLVLTAILIALGTWQVNRLHWKLDLITRVDARVHAAPQPAPGPATWAAVDAAGYEYLHVRFTGTFLHDKETQVYAVTDLGPGYWVMTPIRSDDGTIVVVNRGFVPTDRRDPATRQQGEIPGSVTVTGLLRLTEPKGTLLRSNRPDDERWYSRDIAAMASARGIQNAAPYFIDADATPNPGNLPVGGLTQIVFPNSHLSYAITWYCLAAMTFGMTVYLVHSERRRRIRPN